MCARSTILKAHIPWIQNWQCWQWYDITIQTMNIWMVIMCLGRQFFMYTLGACNHLRWTKPCIFDNSRCRNRLVEHDDASMHPFDQDFVTLKDIHSKTNNTYRQTVFALSWWQLTKWIAFSALPKCQQVSSKLKKWTKKRNHFLMDSSYWVLTKWMAFFLLPKVSAANYFHWIFSGQVAKLHQNVQVCGLVFVDKGTCHPWWQRSMDDPRSPNKA